MPPRYFAPLGLEESFNQLSSALHWPVASRPVGAEQLQEPFVFNGFSAIGAASL